MIYIEYFNIKLFINVSSSLHHSSSPAVPEPSPETDMSDGTLYSENDSVILPRKSVDHMDLEMLLENYLNEVREYLFLSILYTLLLLAQLLSNSRLSGYQQKLKKLSMRLETPKRMSSYS